MDKIELRLTPDPDKPAASPEPEAPGEDKPEPPAQPPEKRADADHPVMGYFAVCFGLLGILDVAFVFTPLGFLCSLFAMFKGQWTWAIVGFLLAFVGLITSPILIAALGLGWVAMMLGL